MSSCAGAGTGHSRTDSQAGHGNIPHRGCRAGFGKGVGRGTRVYLSYFPEFESSLVQGFELCGRSIFFQEFCKIHKNSQVRHSVVTARGLTANQSLGGEKIILYLVLFCIFIVTIVVVIM